MTPVLGPRRRPMHELLSLLVGEDIADVLSEVAGVDALVGFRSGLWVFVAEGTLSSSGAALAVEDIADAAARTVRLEVINRSFEIDPRFPAQVAENRRTLRVVRFGGTISSSRSKDSTLFQH